MLGEVLREVLSEVLGEVLGEVLCDVLPLHHPPPPPHTGGRVEFQRCWRIISEPRRDRPLSGLAVSRSFGDLDFKEPKK